MKGVVNVEFILAVFVFLGTLSFITLTIGRDAIFLRESSFYGNLKTNSIHVSNILIFDKGFPEDWETGPITSIKRLGLSAGEKQSLSKQKIDRLHELCRKIKPDGTPNPDYKTNYEKIKDILSQKGEINLTIKTAGTILDCSPAVETLLRPKFLVNRIITINGAEIGEFHITLID